MKERVVFCWSGGKDSALALYEVLHEGRYEVVSLLTTCNEHFDRVSMHGVRTALTRRQAQALGIPLDVIYLSQTSSNLEYQTKMSEYCLARKSEGVRGMVFGDIFLEDLRQWREANLASVGMYGVFPLWKRATAALIDEFLTRGFAAIVCCVNDAHLGESAVGRVIDRKFIEELPPSVDPCGENGEFHSFAFDGPIFSEPVAFVIGEKVYRDGFWFCDLLFAPVSS